MKTTFSIFTLLLLINFCRAGDITLDTFTDVDSHGTSEFVFNISEARLDSQPAWTPGEQPVPLGIDKALQIAQAWIQKQSWSKRFESFHQITLEHQNCWFYYIDLKVRDHHSDESPAAVMVLLDGSVVEPQLKPPAGSK